MPSLQACEALLDDLRAYARKSSGRQAIQAQRLVDFVNAQHAPWRRSTLEGHLTASAWIVNHAQTHALLVHHKKLSKWLQPGGHIDDDDLSVFHAAFREAREETGIREFEFGATTRSTIFDVDIHPIPAHRTEPEHVHFDIRYRLIARDLVTTLNREESNELRWFPIERIAADKSVDESVRRMAALLPNAS